MKRHISLIIILVMGLQLWTAMAQRQLSEEDRQRWTQKMRQYKHDFLIKELDLTREQQNEFFPLYDAMEDEVNSLTIQTRELESKIAASGHQMWNIPLQLGLFLSRKAKRLR